MHLIRKCPGVVKYIDQKTVYAFRGAKLYISYNNGESWTYRLTLPLTRIEQIQSTHPYLRRLFRKAAHHLVPLDKHSFICIWGAFFFHIDLNKNLAWRLNRVQGSRPLSLHRNKKLLLYGQYCKNPDRKPVSIFMSNNNGLDWKIVHTFDNIRHIHGVFKDSCGDDIWITTGDNDKENGLWVTKNFFQTVEKVIGGTQKTRIVQPLFSPESIFFASDAPQETNYIYKMDRKTKKVVPLQKIDGTVFYGFQDDSSFNFSTVYEGSNPNHLPEAAVWRSNDGINWDKVWSSPKDILSPTLFQYGQFLFPTGKGCSRTLWISPLSVSGDQHSLLLSEKL